MHYTRKAIAVNIEYDPLKAFQIQFFMKIRTVLLVLEHSIANVVCTNRS